MTADHLLRRLRRQGDIWPLAGAMLIMALLLTLLQYGQLDLRLRHDLNTRTHMIARAATAAVVFRDKRDAADILRAFEDAPDVRSARLVWPDGSEFVAYARAQDSSSWLQRHAGDTTARANVVANGTVQAQLVVSASRSGLWLALLGIMGGALAIMLVALAFTRFLSRGLRAKVRHAEDRTQYLAHHDALTGLVNRVAFSGELEHALAQAMRQRHGASLMCVDIDNFKQVNDTHGHGAGDAALQAVASRLSALVRTSDVVARLGGDEFAVLLHAPVAEDVVQYIAVAMTEEPCTYLTPTGATLQVTTSIGVAMLPRDASEADAAMRCADVALYHVKRQGKNGYAVYAPDMGEALRQRRRTEQDLRAALKQDQIALAYQPIYDRDGRLRSFEGLARWNHPERGWIAPSEFIPIAEEAGLITGLGLACLNRLHCDLGQWRRAGLPAVAVALNLSSHQFRGEEDRRAFLDKLDALALGPEEVEFELTETAVFEDMDKPESIVNILQTRGFELALDDFGTGYSSLAYLLRLRCRKLKIDRIFVDGIATRADARLLVDSVVRVAHAIGMVVVAEGVEAAADQACLMELGCDLFQGFGLSRPLPPDQAARCLADHARDVRVFAFGAAATLST
ncbi:MAG TPA: EAL domain-containing protein [Burkholderiaceae bacterium]|nr:EAL domain-containing protein [Burkholderiaceae bacterium]